MAVLPPTGMIASTPAMFFFSARYAVDTFFFIGGYLVMSGMLKVSSFVQCLSEPKLEFGSYMALLISSILYFAQKL